MLLKLSPRPPIWEVAVHKATADDAFAGDLFCVFFFRNVSRVGSGFELCQFLRIVLQDRARTHIWLETPT